MRSSTSGSTTSNSRPPQTVHTSGSAVRAATPQAVQIDTASRRALSMASASASFSVSFAERFGMKRSIASVTRSEETTLWPCSRARRRMAVRAMPSTCSGTRCMRSSASGVQWIDSSALRSSSGTTREVVSSTSQGARRSRFSVFEPRPSSPSWRWTPTRPTTSTHGSTWRAWSRIFWKALPSSSVLVTSTPASSAMVAATLTWLW